MALSPPLRRLFFRAGADSRAARRHARGHDCDRRAAATGTRTASEIFLRPAHGFRLRRRPADHENVLWQDEKIFKAEAGLPEPEPGHSGIPVFFKLPADQPECYARGNESVFWRLEAKSKMRGPDFYVAFEVPVFKVAGAAVAEAADEPDPTAALQMPVEELRRDEHSKIQVTDGPDGREFYFPAARNPGTALFMTLFMLVFNGVCRRHVSSSCADAVSYCLWPDRCVSGPRHFQPLVQIQPRDD